MKYFLLVVVALLVRLALMPLSGHSDLFAISAYPSLLFQEGVVDIFSYVRASPNQINFQYYPPLTYFTLSAFHYTYPFFSDTFIDWMRQIRSLEARGLDVQANYYIINSSNPHIFKDLFLAKFPYLVFDIGAVIILTKFLKKKLVSKDAIIIWLLNPILLYGVYIFGQFEAIPNFFILVGFFLLLKNPYMAVFFLGVAAAYKNYSFIFILPTILIYGDSLKKKLILIAISLLPSIIFIIPTALNNMNEVIFTFVPKSFLHYKRELTGWALYSQILRYLAALVSYVSILLLAKTLRVKNKFALSVGLSLCAMLLLITLAPRTHFHYLLWFTPLLFLWFKRTKTLMLVILIQTLSFASYQILAPELQVGLFAPINPDYFYSLPTFNDIINHLLPYRIVSTIGFFVFLIFNFYLIYKIIYELLFNAEVDSAKQDRK